VQTFTLAGFLVFFVVSLTVGIRLVRLWTRTRQLPELLIGMGVLGIGPVGFGLATVGLVLLPSHPAAAHWLFGAGFLAVGVGAEAKYVFNWRVYHPKSGGVRALAWVAGLLFVLVYLWDLVATGFVDPYAVTPSYLTRSALQVGCLLWGSCEALVYWRRMRRRLRLGLADPAVTNRFLLWGIGAGSAGVGSAVGIVVSLIEGPPTGFSWVMLSSSLHGLVAAVAMWLAFLPPAAYVRMIERRGVPV
jgi:hypothetical protein